MTGYDYLQAGLRHMARPRPAHRSKPEIRAFGLGGIAAAALAPQVEPQDGRRCGSSASPAGAAAARRRLMTALIPEFVSRGITVSTVKHAHHAFDIDQPGKDSWRHRQAGAQEVMVASDRRWALMHELRGAAEPSLDALLQQMSPVDLVLVEGFKRHAHPKIEVYRRVVGKPLLHPEDPYVVAIASDERSPEFPVPWLPLVRCRGDCRFHPRPRRGLVRWRS